MKFIFRSKVSTTKDTKLHKEERWASLWYLCRVPASPRIDVPMTTVTATTAATRRSTGVRILLWILLLLVVSALAYAYSVARAALPKLDGSIPVNGLSASVKVTRDAHGVPA